MSTSFPAVNGQSKDAVAARRLAPMFSSQDVSTRKPIRLSDYRGKVVLLNFWATWCASCLTEMPAFNEWTTQVGARNFQAIGISMDDAPADAVAMVARLKLRYPVLMGDEHLASAYGGVLGLPVSFLIDRQGRMQARYDNADVKSMRRDVEQLIASHK